MTEKQIERKLEQIARLSLSEIEGWLFGIKVAMRPPPFDGEMSALAARKRELMKGRKA